MSRGFGIIVVIVLMVALCVGISSVLNTQYSLNKDNYTIEEYVVKSGDTLWALAERFCDHQTDVRVWIDEVERLNNCASSLQVGQVLLVYVAKT